MSENRASLKVAEADSRDAGRRIARVDPQVAEKLGLETGDALEIIAPSTKRKTTALHWPAYQRDYGKGVIRIDGYARSRLGVGIGDTVDVRKAEAKTVQSIVLAPTEQLRIMGAEVYLAGFLKGQVVSKGDTIPISIMGQRVDLVVISTNPSAGPVIIDSSTEVEVSEESAKAVAAASEGGGHSCHHVRRHWRPWQRGDKGEGDDRTPIAPPRAFQEARGGSAKGSDTAWASGHR